MSRAQISEDLLYRSVAQSIVQQIEHSVLRVVQIAADPSMVPFGAAFPGPGSLATSLLDRSMKNALRRTPHHSIS